MNVLLDESVPRRLAAAFPESFRTRTVQQMGWAGCANGELLRLAADQGFDVDGAGLDTEALQPDVGAERDDACLRVEENAFVLGAVGVAGLAVSQVGEELVQVG